MKWNTDARRADVKAVAVQRVLAVPAFLGVALLQPDAETGWLLGLGALVLLLNLAGAAWLLGPHWQRAPLKSMLLLDSVAIAAGVALSGGGDSDVRFLFGITLVATAVCLPRVLIIMLAAEVIGLTALVVLLIPGDGSGFVFLLTGALATALATTVAWVGEQNATRLTGLADERRTLLADAMDAEHRTRRVLAQDVHDRALQTLLAARQDLQEAADGSPEGLAAGQRGVDVAIRAVQDAVHELHAGALAGELPQALQALAARTGDDAIRVRTDIAETETRHAELLYAVARQLVADATERPGITRIDIALHGDAEHVVLDIGHDGAPEDVAWAARVPLATSAERVAAAGGRLERTSTEARTTVCVRLPV